MRFLPVSNGETQGGRGGNWVHQQSYAAMILATIRAILSHGIVICESSGRLF